MTPAPSAEARFLVKLRNALSKAFRAKAPLQSPWMAGILATIEESLVQEGLQMLDTDTTVEVVKTSILDRMEAKYEREPLKISLTPAGRLEKEPTDKAAGGLVDDLANEINGDEENELLVGHLDNYEESNLAGHSHKRHRSH